MLLIESATSELDLKSPPSNHFEHLKGKLKDFCSVRINEQWRIQFKFINGDSYEVSIVDYH
jgi:proteic killer suppression protein